MTPALALTIAPIVVAWLAPPLLERAAFRVADPLAVLLAWAGAILAVLLTFITGVVLMLAPQTGPTRWMENLAHDCWLAVRHARLPGDDGLLGALAALLVVVLAARIAALSVRRWRGQREFRRAHQDLLTLLGAANDPGADRVLRVPHAEPLAYCVGGRPGLVVLSSGIDRLAPAQRAAVLAHERAHLRGRHHLIVAAAEVLAGALPWVPLARQAPDAVRLLVELSADAEAARACGTTAVRGALIALTGAPHPALALPMAGAQVMTRLRHLGAAAPRRRVSARVLLPLIALATPAGVGIAAVAVLCA
ncbi:M56 family metallopeptidase [Micromonospora thermarum]|uniref:M56 family metallopeptidase n=1 Tax=Micromonospora thermarum TaxID=2720024 RepID=A0ABX0ZFL4_9ACTN|nr:M56 family metallopeptidase [Micromonospora thermarum]NJP35808.1 M56 family metallopeptidase [Micromonospora thermarum]